MHNLGYLKSALKILLLILVMLSVAWAEKTCPNCGAANRDDAKFCKNCGAKLPAPAVKPTTLPRLRADVNVFGNSVAITSTPAGATVLVNNLEVGKTPLELTDLSPGRHELEVKLAGYQTYYGNFTITERHSSIIVTSEPVGADIYLNGTFKGKTTEKGLTISRLKFGQYSVSARLSGYHEVSKTVNLQDPNPVELNLKLAPASGFLSVLTEPDGALAYANEQQIGTTPLFIELPPNRYSLVISKKNYRDWTNYIQISPNETTYVSETLSRVPKRPLPMLIIGLSSFTISAISALIAENSYQQYKQATTSQDASKFRSQTQRWDMIRNIGFGIGTVGIGLYFIIR